MQRMLQQGFLGYVISGIVFSSIAFGSKIASNPGGNITDGVFGSPPESLQTESENPANKSGLIDQGDYYILNTGEKAHFLRHSNTFVLVRKESGMPVDLFVQNLNRRFGKNLEVVKKVNFNRHIVVRHLEAKPQDEIISNLYLSDSSIEFVSPLLTTPKGKGDLAVLPRIIVRIAAERDNDQVLTELSSRFGLIRSAKLDSTDKEYDLAIAGTVQDIGQIFALARELMAFPDIEWAEPVMLVAPEKQFVPNDTLFNQQWHLHNTGQNGAVIDADVDATEGWDLSKGDGTVVAVFDDGVQTNHPDLPIWNNPGESGGGKETNGLDDDSNGYIDDYRGWDFGGGDNNPDPGSTSDNHGTAVAGVAAASGNNALGVSGGAVNSALLPIRSGPMSCTDWGNAMRYAAKYGDVVNNSWGIAGCESELNSAIADAVNGNIPGARRGTKGTPVLFATGNSASGWVKFKLSGIPGGTHTFRWEYVKDIYLLGGYDTVWLDNITWPGGGTVTFEGDTPGTVPSGFTSGGSANWSVVSDGVHARGASGNSVKAGTITDSQSTFLDRTQSVGTGTISYWVWVSSEQGWDFFNFYVDGNLYHHYAPGQYGHVNEVGYPASNPDTIAVGGGTDGATSGLEERVYYSQFGPEVDVIAPTSNQNQGITTTDRTGSDGYDPTDYTSTFGGTSSATPLVAGIAAEVIAFMPSLSAQQVRDALRMGADKIGPYAYPSGRNDYYGYGRVNLFESLQYLQGRQDSEAVVRNEAAQQILLAKHGSGYTPPGAVGTVFDDVGALDFNADWIEQASAEEITDGCDGTRFCPFHVLDKIQVAKWLLRAKHGGSGYSPPVATIAPYEDVPLSHPDVDWIADLKSKGYTEGCGASKYCPNEVLTWGGYKKMLSKVYP